MTMPPVTLPAKKRHKAIKRRLRNRWVHRYLDYKTDEYGDPSDTYVITHLVMSFLSISVLAMVVLAFYIADHGPDNSGNIFIIAQNVFLPLVPFVTFGGIIVIVFGVFVMGISNRELIGTDKVDINSELAKRIFYLYIIAFLIGGALTFGAGPRWIDLWSAYKSEHPFAAAVETFFTSNETLMNIVSLIAFGTTYVVVMKIIKTFTRIKWNMENHARKARHTARLLNHPANPIPDSALTVGAVLWLTPHVSSSRGVYAVVQSDQSLLLPSGATRPADELSLYFTLVCPLSPESYPSTEPGTLGLPKYGNSTVPLLLSSSGWSKPGRIQLVSPGELKYFVPPVGFTMCPVMAT